MIKQSVFVIILIIAAAIFYFSVSRIIKYLKICKPNSVKNIPKRIAITLKVGIGQSKIFRKPIIGFLHALVWWGFLIILLGSIEVIIDGIFGTERVLSSLGFVYEIITALSDVFALIIAVFILIFLFRRLFINVKRFAGTEMKHKSHLDANFALTLIFLLMITLLGTNLYYQIACIQKDVDIQGVYPISSLFVPYFQNISVLKTHFWHEFYWWAHILLILFFANILPYSKHFHVFMSIPNVFFSRLEPLGYLANMPSVTKEVKLMLDPNMAIPEEEDAIERFGVKDVEDVNWKNYMDSLTCTQCGRCKEVCPANSTGKKLSPRKIIMDLRSRMKEKGPGLLKNGLSFNDSKSLLRDYISEEELWACTTCNACAQECPVNINQPSLIVDLRRYLVMEESSAPTGLNTIFANIENNGAPWQFSPEDRMLWANDLYLKL